MPETITAQSVETSDCVELLEHATPSLYRRNLFRVLNLPVDATPADVRKQQKRIEMQRKLGVAKSNGNIGALALKPPPIEQEILAAMDRLNDPQLRLLDELFWFWPISENVSNDAPLCALQGGDIDQAVEFWSNQTKETGYGLIAKHNLAVLDHLRALDHEASFVGGKVDARDVSSLMALWSKSLGHWREVFDGEDFWGRMKDRVRAMDDARLTTGLVRRMRNSLPKALLLINAQLASRAAECGNAELARRHTRLISEAKFPNIAVVDVLREALMPIRRRVKAGIESGRKRWTEDPRHGDQHVGELHHHAMELMAVADCVLPSDDTVRIGIHDMVAEAMSDGAWAYARKTNKWTAAIRLVELARSTAESEAQKTKQENEIGRLREIADSGNDWCAPGYWDLSEETLTRLELIRATAEGGDLDGAIEALAVLDRKIGKFLLRCMGYCLSLKGIRIFNDAQGGFSFETSVRKKLFDLVRQGNVGGLAMLLARRPDPNTPMYLNPPCPCCGSTMYNRWTNFTYKDLPMWMCGSCSATDDRELEQQKKPLRDAMVQSLEYLLLADEIDPKDTGVLRNLEGIKKMAKDFGCSLPTTKALRAKIGSVRRTARKEAIAASPADHLCYFCNRNTADPRCQIAVPMCSEVQKIERLMGDQLSWTQADVIIPRCASCHKAHKELSDRLTNWERARHDSESGTRFADNIAGLREYVRELNFAQYPHSGISMSLAGVFSPKARKRARLLREGTAEKTRRITQLRAAIAKSRADFRASQPPPTLPAGIRPESEYRNASQLKRRETSGWGYGLEPNEQLQLHVSAASIESDVRGMVSRPSGTTPTSESAENVLNAIADGRLARDEQLTLFSPPSAAGTIGRPARKPVWKILFSFSGRIQRSEFFIGLSVVLSVSALLAVSIYLAQPIQGFDGASNLRIVTGIIAIVIGALDFIMLLAILIKRLHDRNRSGGFVACMLIPYWQVIHLFWMAVECCRDGTIGRNRFGEDPKQRTIPEAPKNCFFCGTGEPASGSSLQVELYKGTATNWKPATEKVNRCKQCAERHQRVRKLSRTFGWVGAILAGLSVWLTIGWLCSRHASPDDQLPAFWLAGILPGILIAGPLGALIASNAGRFIAQELHLYCVKPYSSRYLHPSVYKKLVDGWKRGKKPSGAK